MNLQQTTELAIWASMNQGLLVAVTCLILGAGLVALTLDTK